jgi:hypoxanthine phosphoribosyltransferase
MTEDGITRPRVAFVHPSEEQFARILDFYQISWEYEPRTFALRWDKDGNVIEAFSPDFYLPEQDLYVELTTMEQRLITKKHRKLRQLRKLYPEINIKLLNRSDFKGLMLKYGLDEEEALIGMRDRAVEAEKVDVEIGD